MRVTVVGDVSLVTRHLVEDTIRLTLALEPDPDRLVISVWHDRKRWWAEVFRLPERPDQPSQPMPGLVAVITRALLSVRRTDLV